MIIEQGPDSTRWKLGDLYGMECVLSGVKITTKDPRKSAERKLQELLRSLADDIRKVLLGVALLEFPEYNRATDEQIRAFVEKLESALSQNDDWNKAVRAANCDENTVLEQSVNIQVLSTYIFVCEEMHEVLKFHGMLLPGEGDDMHGRISHPILAYCVLVLKRALAGRHMAGKGFVLDKSLRDVTRLLAMDGALIERYLCLDGLMMC